MGAGTSTLFDASGFGNHGTLTNMAIPATATSGWGWDNTLGRFGLNYSTGQYVSIAGTPDLSFAGGGDIPFSLSVWANLTDATNSGLVGKATATGVGFAEWGFWFGADDKLNFACWSGGDTSKYIVGTTAALTAIQGTATHIVGTYNGSAAKEGLAIYVNGVPKSLTLGSSGYVSMTNTGVVVRTGTGYGSTHPCKGRLCDNLIFRRQLSPTEIAALADPSNVMLRVGGVSLIQEPRRVLWRVAPVGGGFKPYWVPRTNRRIGAFA